MTKTIRVIINPAAGKGSPDLNLLNKILQDAGYEWNMSVTNQTGDATLYAQLAVERKEDIVAVYGGDGTVTEVAVGLLGSGIPLAIFPGGTANVISVELGISNNLEEAVAMACSEKCKILDIDIGRFNNDKFFLLRVGMGLEGEMVEGANRDLKDKVGGLAYSLSALQAVQKLQESNYNISIDGNQINTSGVTCLICNSVNLGKSSFSLSPDVSVTDGLLDLFVLKQIDIGTFLNVAKDVMTGQKPKSNNLQHWQGKQISVTSDPAQVVQYDGEVLGKIEISAEIIPRAVRVVVPDR